MANDKGPQEFTPAGERISIFLRGRTWYCNYQHNGRQIRRSLSTQNKKEAILRAQRIEADLDRGAIPDQIRIASLEEICQGFIRSAEVEGRAPKTLAKYRNVVEQIKAQAEKCNISNVTQLNADFADTWREALRKKHQAPKTIYGKSVILRSLTLFALRRRLTDVDSLAGYKLRKPKAKPQPCWTPEEAEQILQATPEAYRPYFTFLRETGCRAGEGKFLTWSDVDFKRGEILIRPKDEWKPKTGDQRRVPLTARLAALLQSQPRHGRWVFQAAPTRLHPDVGRQVSERRALLALKRVLKRLKLKGHLHTFRHTFISQALSAGVPEAVVRSWVGHVDPDVLRLYTHISDDVSKSYVSRFTAASTAAGCTKSDSAARAETE
ncbi:MAG: site-specific integrase [Planctomycetota bacterium]